GRWGRGGGGGGGGGLDWSAESAGRRVGTPVVVRMVSTGASRRPAGPGIKHTARAATSAGTLSAAGEALQRLPPSEARPCTWVEPIRLAASTTPGQAATRSAFSPSSAPGVAAPTTKPPPRG